jgi:hypothetical protein
MRANPGGSSGVFVNVASTTGVRPGPGLCWYSGSKGAVITTSKGLALELARENIRVCVVNPMIGETAMLEQFMGLPDTPENRQRFLARIPLGRFTKPADVAGAAVYLASDEAQMLYAKGNFEYPVNPAVEIDPLVKSWGSFTPDTPLATLAATMTSLAVSSSAGAILTRASEGKVMVKLLGTGRVQPSQ